MDVFTGPPGKVHDSRVFKLSFISAKLPQMCVSEGSAPYQYHLVGDGAYPLREYLMTPYKDYGNIQQKQSKFNSTLSSTRVLIENAFGLLKQRFRQLQHLELFTVDRCTKLIIACCVLQNLAIDAGEGAFTDGTKHDLRMKQNEYLAEKGLREGALRRLGAIKHDKICNTFVLR